MSFPSLSSDPSHDIITVGVLNVNESEVQWDISWWHCLNETKWLLFHQFTVIVLDMDKSEIMWDIGGNFDGLWFLILLEVVIDVVVIAGFNELVVQWDLTKSCEGLSSITCAKWFIIGLD